MGLARTAGRPAGSHCACDRVASGFHALRAGGRVRNPLVPPADVLNVNLLSFTNMDITRFAPKPFFVYDI